MTHCINILPKFPKRPAIAYNSIFEAAIISSDLWFSSADMHPLSTYNCSQLETLSGNSTRSCKW